jgi:hypothetical protein
MGLDWIEPVGAWCRISTAAAQYVVTHPQRSYNPIHLDFLLDRFSKIESLFIYVSTDTVRLFF